MVSSFNCLYRILLPRDRWQFLLIVILAIIQLLLELIGLGSLMPFIKLFTHPDTILQNPFFKNFISILPGFITPGEGQEILLVGGLILFFFLFKSVFSIFFFYAFQRFSANKQALITCRIFDLYLNMDYQTYLRESTPILIKNVCSESKRLAGLLNAFQVLFSELLVFFGILTFLFWIAPRTTLGIIAFFGSFAVFFYYHTRKLLNIYAREVSEADGDFFKYIQDSLLGFKELNTFHKQGFFSHLSFMASKKSAEKTYKYTTIQSLPRILLETFGMIGILFLILIKSLSKSDVLSIIPELTVIGAAFYRLLPSVNRIVTSLANIKYFQYAANLIDSEFTRMKQPVAQDSLKDPLPFKKELKIQDIFYTYPEGDKSSLNGISLNIKPGEFIGITGASGSGKTTLVDILLGLLTPQQGQILLDETKIQRGNLVSYHETVAYVPQNIFLLDESIEANIAFGVGPDNWDRELINKSVKCARLEPIIQDLKDGIKSFIGDRGLRLSGGQKQRIGIARALYRNPKILILDEATSALDNITESQIISEMWTLNKENNLTLIVIAHRLSTIKNADRILVLDQGKLVGFAPHEELLKNCQVYKDLTQNNLPL